MSLIKNLIKEPERKPHKSKNLATDCDDDDNEASDSEKQKKIRPVIKSATDLQRLRLEKLMKNPDKPVIIPEPRKDKDYMQTVPTFVRNVMGSSAGAGSGEFHVYRHLRRKEYARQKTIQAKSIKEHQDEEYQRILEENRRAADEKTAKKRAKRLKKKQRAKRQRKDKGKDKAAHGQEERSDSEDDDDDESDSEEKHKIEEVVNKTNEKQANENEKEELVQDKAANVESAFNEISESNANEIDVEENHHKNKSYVSNKNEGNDKNAAETMTQAAVEEETKFISSESVERSEEATVKERHC